ncbi:MAG: class B sortase [Oscillospiraceae bacterium]|jgi:sortase B|nr:class B sortase [Oscillospiraceae bacterium]
MLAGGFSVSAAQGGSGLPADAAERESRRTVAAITPDFGENIKEKKAQNSDTIGWLYVPGTEINNVILQNPGNKSNSYYLTRDFYGNPDKDGLYCADFRARFGDGRRKSLSRIVTLFGHSWEDDPNGRLFAQLKKYRDPQFARDNPYIFFSTGSENMAWEVFAVFDTTIDLPYITPDLSDNHFFDMLDIVSALSVYDYGIEIHESDRILTLSTCTYAVKGQAQLPYYNDYRFAIMARLAGPDEEAKNEAVFSQNGQTLKPDAISKEMKARHLPPV